MFTSETREQPIATQLLEDRTGESAEYFIICLPEQELQRMGAEAVAPTCVRIVILDDDCKTFQIDYITLIFILYSYFTLCMHLL